MDYFYYSERKHYLKSMSAYHISVKLPYAQYPCPFLLICPGAKMYVLATVNEENMELGIIKKSIGTNNQVVFSQLCKALVRPILKYSAPVWSPYLIKDIVALEKVQRRTLRLALRQNRGEIRYEQRCSLLKWQTLEKRRELLSLVQCYRFSQISLNLPKVLLQELITTINST